MGVNTFQMSNQTTTKLSDYVNIYRSMLVIVFLYTNAHKKASARKGAHEHGRVEAALNNH